MTRFVYNDELWQEIGRNIAKAKRVSAAVSYLGKGGAKILPLKRGDRLVVDMSLGAVRQGVTDPREIRLLMRSGVKVFSRGSLHAKFLVADRTLVAGSANASYNSMNNLDEAGITTTDAAALRRAMDFFEGLCTEPVGPEYLKKCIAEYRPPRFKAANERRPARRKNRSRRIVEAKLWFIAGLVSLNDQDDARDAVERRHQRKLVRPERTVVRSIRYSRVPKFLRQLRVGDWVVDCMRDGRGRYVGAPGQILGFDEYSSENGRKYKLLLLETPQHGEAMSLTEFRRRIAIIQPLLNRPSPRTRPIIDQQQADDILRMWTATGAVATRKVN